MTTKFDRMQDEKDKAQDEKDKAKEAKDKAAEEAAEAEASRKMANPRPFGSKVDPTEEPEPVLVIPSGYMWDNSSGRLKRNAPPKEEIEAHALKNAPPKEEPATPKGPGAKKEEK